MFRISQKNIKKRLTIEIGYGIKIKRFAVIVLRIYEFVKIF